MYEVVSLKSLIRTSDSKEAISKGFTEHTAGPPLNLFLTDLRVSCDISSLLAGHHMVTDETKYVNDKLYIKVVKGNNKLFFYLTTFPKLSILSPCFMAVDFGRTKISFLKGRAI
jgi:hypothetical protein